MLPATELPWLRTIRSLIACAIGLVLVAIGCRRKPKPHSKTGQLGLPEWLPLADDLQRVAHAANDERARAIGCGLALDELHNARRVVVKAHLHKLRSHGAQAAARHLAVHIELARALAA